MWKKRVMAYFKILSMHFLEVMSKIKRNLSHNSQFLELGGKPETSKI